MQVTKETSPENEAKQYQVVPFFTEAPESTSNWCVDLGPVLRIAGQCTFANLPKPSAKANGLHEHDCEMLEGV